MEETIQGKESFSKDTNREKRSSEPWGKFKSIKTHLSTL
jgi:hypothetical protein